MSDRPYQPFYKPYGMSDEEFEYEQRLAQEKLEQWEMEQGEQEKPKILFSNCCGAEDKIDPISEQLCSVVGICPRCHFKCVFIEQETELNEEVKDEPR